MGRRHGEQHPQHARHRRKGQAVRHLCADPHRSHRRTIQSAFRSGWQGDYPQQYGFLAQNYQTGGSSNDGEYSNPEFDRLLRESAGQTDKAKAQELLDQAQEVLLKDLPAIPTWYRNAASGWSENVSNVTISWNGIPVYEDIEKN